MSQENHLGRGCFVTLEGTEGVGKTTNLAFIEAWMKERSIEYLVTREPGGTPLAEQLRELLLAPREENVDPVAELLMVFAARAQHLNTVILPALSRGLWVLCDRFTDATYAYQGHGRGLSVSLIEQLECVVQKDVRPDLTLILDIDPALGLQRASERSVPDRFEQEQMVFFDRVRKGYRACVDQHPGRYQVINAAQSLEQVQADISAALAGFVTRFR